MKKTHTRYLALAAISCVALVLVSCKAVDSVTQQLTQLKKLQFKLDGVSKFSLAGINLSSKKSISDFSIADGLKLTQAFSSKKFPASFVLDVAAKNPNSGNRNSGPSLPVTLSKLDWRLFIDDSETIRGNIKAPVTIPSSNKPAIIPLSMALDLYQFFGSQGYERIVNLALAIGGVGGGTSKLKLVAKPTVTTSLGNIEYPGFITIVDTEYTSE